MCRIWFLHGSGPGKNTEYNAGCSTQTTTLKQFSKADNRHFKRAYSPNIYTVFEGDCDNDDECKGDFKCGKHNCLDMNPGSRFSAGADCCYDPNPNSHQVNIKSYKKNQVPILFPVCQTYVRNPKQKVFLKSYVGKTIQKLPNWHFFTPAWNLCVFLCSITLFEVSRNSL